MKTLSMILTLGLALCAVGCGAMLKGKRAAEAGVAEFHALYNAGHQPAIFAASHSKLKEATTEVEFLELLAAVQGKLGQVMRTSSAGINISTQNFTTTVILNQRTTFERGTGRETFTFQMQDERALLVGYHIESREIALN